MATLVGPGVNVTVTDYCMSYWPPEAVKAYYADLDKVNELFHARNAFDAAREVIHDN